MMKLVLFLVLLYALPQTDCWYTNLETIRSQWVLLAPGKVWAARGSCLVLPGSFRFPKRPSPVRRYVRYWKKDDERVTAAASSVPATHIHAAYRGRTRFLGSKRDCTWEIRRVQDRDAGSYFFRLLLPEYQVPQLRYSWRYQPTMVQVVDAKRPVMSLKVGGACGEEVVAFCSVAHTCPSHPPVLSWSCSGSVLSGSSPTPGGWLWVSYSTLTFTKAENSTLRMYCSARHDGGRRLDSNVISV